MKSVGRTHLGLVRKTNQDNFLSMNNQNEYCIFAVADGLGGHNAGEVASSYAVDELADYFASCAAPHLFGENDTVTEFIHTINQGIFAMSAQSSNLAGMGTTLTLCVTDGKTASFYHVGDSRAYLIDDGIHQLSKDHSLVQYLIDHGQITPEEGLHHPKKHIITRALGTDESVKNDTLSISLTSESKLLICSDGLTNMGRDEKILEIVQNNDTERAVDLLIDEANANGGNDNITVVIFENK
jgi:protein phosphatase